MTRRRHRVLLDTGVLLAAVLPRDPAHDAAIDVLDRLGAGAWRSAHTTDYVLAEALNYIRMKVRRRDTADALLALAFGHEDAPPLLGTVLRVHSARFARALGRYRAEFDRGLSLTDWTTVVAAEDAGIERIATFDRAFRGVAEVVDGPL